MIDERILANRKLIAQLESLIKDDGMKKRRRARKPKIEPQQTAVAEARSRICSCIYQTVNGVRYRMGDPSCLQPRHGTFGKTGLWWARKGEQSVG